MDPAVQQIMNEVYQVLISKEELTPERRQYITGLIKGQLVSYTEAAKENKKTLWQRLTGV